MELLEKLEAAEFKNESLKNQLREVVKAAPEYSAKKAQKTMLQIVYAMAQIFKEDAATVVKIFSPEKAGSENNGGVTFKSRTIAENNKKKPLRVGGKQCEDCQGDEPDDEQEQKEDKVKATPENKKTKTLTDCKNETEVLQFFKAGSEAETIKSMRGFCKASSIKISGNAGAKSIAGKIFEFLKTV